MRVLLLIFAILSFASVYAQDLMTDNKVSGIKLIVDSDPADAEVYIDGQLYGRTPLYVKELSPGKYEVKIKKEPFKTFTKKVECPALGYNEVFSVLDGKYALLNLESTVSGAEVFMGDSLLGTAPLHNARIPLGLHTILVKSSDFFDWNMQLNAAPTQYNLKAVMKYRYGYVTLTKGLEGSEIFIDDKNTDVSKLNNFKIEVGEHKIEVNHPSFSSPIEENFLVSSEKRSSMKIESGYFSLGVFFKSFFLPGLGQYQDGAKIKGITIFSGTLLSGLVWLGSGLSNADKMKEYRNAGKEYSGLSTPGKLFVAHNRLISTYDAVKKSNNMKNIAMSAFIAVYAYNILDALILHSKGQRLIITQEKPEGNSFNIGFNMAL